MARSNRATPPKKSAKPAAKPKPSAKGRPENAAAASPKKTKPEPVAARAKSAPAAQTKGAKSKTAAAKKTQSRAPAKKTESSPAKKTKGSSAKTDSAPLKKTKSAATRKSEKTRSAATKKSEKTGSAPDSKTRAEKALKGKSKRAGSPELRATELAGPELEAVAPPKSRKGSRKKASEEPPAEPPESPPPEAVLESDAATPSSESEVTADSEALVDTAAFLKGLVEAILFVSDRPLSLKELARAAKIDKKRAGELVLELQQEYAGRGFALTEVAGGLALRTSAMFASYVRNFLSQRPVRLSRPQLETLAIVAYRQPITRPEIDEIRGVDSGPVLKGLLERELIKILGKKDEAGRPMLYGTTDSFLELFSMESLRELPTLKEFTELSDESRQVFETRIGEEVPEGTLEFGRGMSDAGEPASPGHASEPGPDEAPSESPIEESSASEAEPEPEPETEPDTEAEPLAETEPETEPGSSDSPDSGWTIPDEDGSRPN